MDKFQYDQAEGLRRMLAGPRPRIYTFVSAIPDEDRNGVLINLGASLAGVGSTVLMVDARLATRSLSAQVNPGPARPTLLQAARGECAFEEAVAETQQGFWMTTLTRTRPSTRRQRSAQKVVLDHAFADFASEIDVVLVDAELDEEDGLPLAAMEEGEIVVLVSAGPASIKEAYALIKRLSERFGRRPFGILVTGTSEQRAQVVFRNMAQAASRYLAVKLHAVGSVPADEHVSRASRLGRAVVEAFPMAGASVAFRHLAGRFADSRLSSGMGLGA